MLEMKTITSFNKVKKNESKGALIYKTIDKSKIPEGKSGSPVITARLAIKGNQLFWEFKVEAIIFAVDETTNEIHTCPIQTEMSQVLQILLAKEFSKRV